MGCLRKRQRGETDGKEKKIGRKMNEEVTKRMRKWRSGKG